jgi:hypothetical protein
VDPPAEPSTAHPDHAETASEEKSETPVSKAASFKIPKLSAPQPTARTQSGEKSRCQETARQKPVPEADETMAVNLDLEVSEEDRKFVESSTSDNIGKLLDEFIGDKKSPEKSVPRPVLKKPEDTVKRPATTTGRKLSFADDPPKSALGLMAAALKKSSRADKTDGKSDEVELRHLVKNLSSAQRATFRKMLTSTAPSPKKSSKKGRK